MKKNDRLRYKTFGKNRSLRLKGYDYSTPTAYFLTLCSAEGRNVFSETKLAEHVIDCLMDCSSRYDYKLLAYCLMPDHLHLLVCPNGGERPVPQYVQAFNSRSTRVFWQCSGNGRLWQRGFYDHIVRKDETLVEIAEYILANPVRKGLADDPVQYPFSGAAEDFSLT